MAYYTKIVNTVWYFFESGAYVLNSSLHQQRKKNYLYLYFVQKRVKRECIQRHTSFQIQKININSNNNTTQLSTLISTISKDNKKKTRKVPHSLLGEWGTPHYSGAALVIAPPTPPLLCNGSIYVK